MIRKMILTTFFLLLTISCSKKKESSDSLEVPSSDISEIEGIEVNELNKYGIELNYVRTENYHKVGLSDKSKDNYAVWIYSDEAMRAVNHYIEVTDKFVKKYSYLEQKNKKVAEIMLKNQFFKENIESFQFKSSSNRNKMAHTYGENHLECSDQFNSLSNFIFYNFNEIFPYGVDSESSIKAAKLYNSKDSIMHLNAACDQFYSEYGMEKVSCYYYSKETGYYKIDESYRGWKTCEKFRAAKQKYPKYF
ncbi:MAG: hypothetical protein QE271_08635 [Bacteriovoracaceae bacterium]|nr:hypothetical protein [Bacteriovoracaceae bacterium]